MKLLNLISENIDGFGLSTDSEAQPQYRINKKPIKCSSRFGKFKSLFGVGGPKERLLYELVITKIVNSDVGFVNNMYMYSDENNNIKGIILSIKKATVVENKIIFDKDGTQVVSLVCPKVQTINDLEFEIIQKYKQSATFNPTDTNLTQETQQHNNEGYETLTLGTPNINRTTKPLKINDTVILKTDLIKMKEPELKKRYIITNIKNENEITIQTGEGEESQDRLLIEVTKSYINREVTLNNDTNVYIVYNQFIDNVTKLEKLTLAYSDGSIMPYDVNKNEVKLV